MLLFDGRIVWNGVIFICAADRLAWKLIADTSAYVWRVQASIYIAYTQVDYAGNHDDIDHKDLAQMNYLFFREFSPAERPAFADTRLHESIQELNLSG